MTIGERLRGALQKNELAYPFPATGLTAQRHLKLFELARKDLPLARLAEAHTDALAIIHELKGYARPGLYGVWAADGGAKPLQVTFRGERCRVSGLKQFCSGAGLVDRALVTAQGFLFDIDLRGESASLETKALWKVAAFAETNTAAIEFSDTPVEAVIGEDDWYLRRPGFWHGACGPAACWAGGAAALVDYALREARNEPHALAHLGAMQAAEWDMRACLVQAGNEIDAKPFNIEAAHRRALIVRHLIEQRASEILRRFGRIFGPRPLAFDADTAKLYQEVEIYIRQCHAERDLETLGRLSQSA